MKILSDEYENLSVKEKKKYEKIIQTRDIKRFYIDWHKEYIPKEIYSEGIVSNFLKDKIVIARVTKSIQAVLDLDKYYVGKSTLLFNLNCPSKFLLAILNSKLINYWYFSCFETTHMAGGYLRYDIPYLKQIPIKKTSKSKQKQLIGIVDKILDITKEDNYLKNPEKQAKVKAYERQIDRLVYSLYGLTPKEIKIVEGEN